MARSQQTFHRDIAESAGRRVRDTQQADVIGARERGLDAELAEVERGQHNQQRQ